VRAADKIIVAIAKEFYAVFSRGLPPKPDTDEKDHNFLRSQNNRSILAIASSTTNPNTSITIKQKVPFPFHLSILAAGVSE
jgi:hypothetical protein